MSSFISYAAKLFWSFVKIKSSREKQHHDNSKKRQKNGPNIVKKYALAKTPTSVKAFSCTNYTCRDKYSVMSQNSLTGKCH